jgi:hypothetical protein
MRTDPRCYPCPSFQRDSDSQDVCDSPEGGCLLEKEEADDTDEDSE